MGHLNFIIVRKTYCNDFPYNDRKVNKCECEKYLVNINHSPIITQEKFDQVQAEKIRRSNIQIDENTSKRKHTHYSMKKSNLDHDDDM